MHQNIYQSTISIIVKIKEGKSSVLHKIIDIFTVPTIHDKISSHSRLMTSTINFGIDTHLYLHATLLHEERM